LAICEKGSHLANFLRFFIRKYVVEAKYVVWFAFRYNLPKCT